MLNRLPERLPRLSVLLEDIGNPSACALATALSVSPRTARRWIAQDDAPRAVLCAIYWLTRWGHASVDAEAANAARVHAQHARALQDKLTRTERDLERLLAMCNSGAANAPLYRY